METIEGNWYSLETLHGLSIGDSAYIAEIMPTQGEFFVTPCHIRDIRSNGETNYFVATEETKECRARAFYPCDIGNRVFTSPLEADELVESAKAHYKGENVSDERYYEED